MNSGASDVDPYPLRITGYVAESIDSIPEQQGYITLDLLLPRPLNRYEQHVAQTDRSFEDLRFLPGNVKVRTAILVDALAREIGEIDDLVRNLEEKGGAMEDAHRELTARARDELEQIKFV